MLTLNQILSELLLSLYECEVLIKTDANYNKVDIYNEIRALKGVVVVNIVRSDYLDNQRTENYEYSLLKVKFLGARTAEEEIKKITLDAKVHSKIEGLHQFKPRFQTIKKIGEYH